MKVTCKLLVQNRKVTVEVVPSATALLIKALKEPPRDRKKVKHISHDGNLSWEDVFAVARSMRCLLTPSPSKALCLRCWAQPVALAAQLTVKMLRMLPRWCRMMSKKSQRLK